MKRIDQAVYTTDSGAELLKLSRGRAEMLRIFFNADELEELASACLMAADELRNRVEVEAV